MAKRRLYATITGMAAILAMLAAGCGSSSNGGSGSRRWATRTIRRRPAARCTAPCA